MCLYLYVLFLMYIYVAMRHDVTSPEMPHSVGDTLEQKWQQELQDIEQRRNDLLPEHQKKSQHSQSQQ